MAEIHHFDHGVLTPAVSYVLSVLGSLLGLTCAVRLRNAHSKKERTWWLILAALAIGGTGIWTMHFVAMLGFSVMGTPIRYAVAPTAVSAVLAIGGVAIGLLLVFSGRRFKVLRLAAGGIFAGLGVAAMHYTGMAAMRLNGQISYDQLRVIISVVIAIIAATVALWLTDTVQKRSAIFGSALVMGIAVNGMHFTGMSAMSVRTDDATSPLPGATASTLLIPIGVAVLFAVLGLAFALEAAPTAEDRAGTAYLNARLGPADNPRADAPVETVHPAGSLLSQPNRLGRSSPQSNQLGRQAAFGRPSPQQPPLQQPPLQQPPAQQPPARQAPRTPAQQGPLTRRSALFGQPAPDAPGNPNAQGAQPGPAFPGRPDLQAPAGWPAAESNGWPAAATEPAAQPGAGPEADGWGDQAAPRQPSRKPTLGGNWTYRDRARDN